MKTTTYEIENSQQKNMEYICCICITFDYFEKDSMPKRNYFLSQCDKCIAD